MDSSLIVLLSQDAALRSALHKSLRESSELIAFDDPAEALTAARKRDVWLFIVDARHRETLAEGFVRRLQELRSQPELLLLLPSESTVRVDLPPENLALEPVEEQGLLEQLWRLWRRQRVRRESGILGNAPAIRELLATIAQVAPLDVPVLIQGESGTGKEMVARALHEGSPRNDRPFVSINVGSLAETLLESELFGHEKGAFTGAVSRRAGVFERANGGTLFLDEVGEMSPAMQVKLLRVLESNEYQRVGGGENLRTDVRLLAATHRTLDEEMRTGRFRGDLYYRLKVVKIEIPPLRERTDDILLLAHHFLEEANRRHGLRRKGFTLEAMDHLRRYAWPGNVRELRNVVSSMAVLGHDEFLGLEDLPEELQRPGGHDGGLPVRAYPTPGLGDRPEDQTLLTSTLLALMADVRRVLAVLHELQGRVGRLEGHMTGQPPADLSWEDVASDAEFTPLHPETAPDLRSAERSLIQAALRQCGGNRRKTAEQLGISERTLYRKLKEYELS